MVLVDTSVLIDYFKGVNNNGTKRFEYILNQNIKFGISNLIFIELLQGSKDINEFNILKEYLKTQIFYDLNNKNSYEEAAGLYMNCRKKGITLRSTIDVIISQTA